MLFTLPALCVVAAHFILILILRLFRNNRNIRCDRDVDCAACCSAAVSALASIFSVSVAALSPPFHSLCWQLCCCLCNDFLSLQHYIILINLFTIIHHTHSHLQWNMFICLFIANYSQNHVREISIQQQREYLQLLLQLEQSNNNNN